MELSIVIVSYNVKYFLDLALKSALEASKNMACEIFVVDNASSDGTVQFIEKHYPKSNYPTITLLANKENLGFSKANNQAIRESKGEFVLLLNPDTIVAEDTFTKTIGFMRNNPDAGALGVKMIDGSGKFLPESKRGLPTPLVSFYKMTGLSKLFPKSETFGKYHLGFLEENKINKVDVLSGAFILLRTETLNKVGLLDETYFMYGEDIDLSYRITEGGYTNYYFPDTSIIHFKGESTKKQSAHYVKVFYGAMQIFVKKHFGGSGAGIIAFLLSLAINLRAGFALFQRIIVAIALPVIDFLVLYLGFYTIAKYWEHYNKWVKAIYPVEYYTWHIPIYILFIIFSILLSHGYRKPISGKRIIRGVFLGGIILFVLYGLAPKSLQYSRAILGLGIVWSILGVILIRVIIQFVKHGNLDIGSTEKKKSVLIGDITSLNNYLNHAEKSFQKTNIVGTITIDKELERPNVLHLGALKDLDSISTIYDINELIICANNLSFKDIISCFKLNDKKENIRIKLIDQEKQYLIGSYSKNKSGILWTYGETPAYFNKETQIKKRVQDIFICLAIPFFSPIIILKGKWELFKNIPAVLLNKYNWVNPKSSKHLDFPQTKKGVYSPTDILPNEVNNVKNRNNLDIEYLLNYDVNKDVKIIWHNLLH